MNPQAVRSVADFVSSRLNQCNISEQIRLYRALAEIMPTAEERLQAERISWTLEEAAKLQLDFTRQLFRELQWPSHPQGSRAQK